MMYYENYPEFFTATNLNWLPVLHNVHHKQILIEALKRRKDTNQIIIYAFVIMPNHFHCIWRINNGINKSDFQRDLMKFTARSILSFMRMHNDPLLNKLKVSVADRSFQVWERNSLSIPLYTDEVFTQKVEYIHNNPLQSKWQLSKTPEDYFYSSARFYEFGENDFEILTHYLE